MNEYRQVKEVSENKELKRQSIFKYSELEIADLKD